MRNYIPNTYNTRLLIQFIIVAVVTLVICYVLIVDSQFWYMAFFLLCILPIMFILSRFALLSLSAVLKRIRYQHIAWMCLFIGLFMLKGRSTASLLNDSVQAQQWLRIVAALLGSVVIAPFFLQHFSKIRRINGPLLFFWIYAIVALISSFYSIYFGYSAWKAIELIIGLCVVTSMLCSDNPVEEVATLQSVTITWNHFLLLLVAAGVFYAPGVALRKCYGAALPLLTGVIPVINANSVGTMAALAVVYCLIKTTGKNSYNFPIIIYLIIFSGMLFFSNSRTSLIGIFIVSSFLLFIRQEWKWLVLIILIGLFVWRLAGGGTFFVDSYFLRGDALNSEDITSLSGRTRGWEAAIFEFKKSPLAGYGYAAGSRLQALPASGASQEAMHGAIFSILVNNGVIGFVPWCISFLSAFSILLKHIINDPVNDKVALNFCFLVILGVKFLTSDALVYLDIFTMFYLTILINVQLVKK